MWSVAEAQRAARCSGRLLSLHSSGIKTTARRSRGAYLTTALGGEVGKMHNFESFGLNEQRLCLTHRAAQRMWDFFFNRV